MLVDPARPNFDRVPGWKPVMGGVEHLTGLASPAPAGQNVDALCGARCNSAEDRPPARYSCSFCAAVYMGVDA